MRPTPARSRPGRARLAVVLVVLGGAIVAGCGDDAESATGTTGFFGEACGNGVDDDGDGDADCADRDCSADRDCRPDEACLGGVDEDDDGAVDCADPDCADAPGCQDDGCPEPPDCALRACAGEPACAPVEQCGNDADDDDDGDVDCADEDCEGSASCLVQEVCDNHFDDDQDGAIDCADHDCTRLPPCFGEPEDCDDGEDDDADGDADCADADCADDPACAPSRCGNGVVESGEDCDDGDVEPGDGCDACAVEPFDAASHRCVLPEGFRNDFGGCCDPEGDSCRAGLVCTFGYCTLGDCDDDGDCESAFADGEVGRRAFPFPEGTGFRCVVGPPGLVSLCVAGGLDPCGGADDDACPEGETCAMLLNDVADLAHEGVAGFCATRFLGAGAPGSPCDPASAFACGSTGFTQSCFGGRCTEACSVDDEGASGCSGDYDACYGPFVDLLDDPNDLLGGGGLCVGPRCGRVSIASAGVDESLDPEVCGAGLYCDFTGADPAGVALEFRCLGTTAGGGTRYASCDQDPFFGASCAASGLCLQSAPMRDPAGAICATTVDCCPAGPDGCAATCVFGSAAFGRCSPRAEAGFCSSLCATGDVCGPEGVCADLDLGEVDGAAFTFPACVLPEAPVLPCDGEADCVGGADRRGCFPLALVFGDRQAGGGCFDATGDPEGALCDDDDGCAQAEVCVEGDEDGAPVGRCTAVAVVGDACTPGSGGNGGRCLSGLCLDHALGDDGPTACSGFCVVNADCAEGQTCTPVLGTDNGTADPGDDTVFGLCLTRVPIEPEFACAEAVDCVVAGDACDPAGACYTAGAPLAAPCTRDADCDAGGACLRDDAEGGYCVAHGCAAGGTGVEAGCPGADDRCVGAAGAPGTCSRPCSADEDCTAVNPSLACRDQDGDGTVESCSL